MVERKSKPKSERKGGDDAEPAGWDALKQNAWFILVMIIVVIAGLVAGVIMLSQFLSGRSATLDHLTSAIALIGLA